MRSKRISEPGFFQGIGTSTSLRDPSERGAHRARRRRHRLCRPHQTAPLVSPRHAGNRRRAPPPPPPEHSALCPCCQQTARRAQPGAPSPPCSESRALGSDEALRVGYLIELDVNRPWYGFYGRQNSLGLASLSLICCFLWLHPLSTIFAFQARNARTQFRCRTPHPTPPHPTSPRHVNLILPRFANNSPHPFIGLPLRQLRTFVCVADSVPHSHATNYHHSYTLAWILVCMAAQGVADGGRHGVGSGVV